MNQWQGHSACKVIRFLGAMRVPLERTEQVLPTLGFRVSPSTLRIQWRKGFTAEAHNLPLGSAEKLLATVGTYAKVDSLPRRNPANARKVVGRGLGTRKRIRIRLDDPDGVREGIPKGPYLSNRAHRGLNDLDWWERVRKQGWDEEVTDLQFRIHGEKHGNRHNSVTLLACWYEAVKIIRRKRGEVYKFDRGN